MFITAVLLLSLTAFFTLWILFLAVMNLQERRAQLKGLNKYAAYLVLALGYIVDFIVQIGPASLLWLELPKETTVSARVARLVRSGHGYRYKLAVWFRDNLLKLFDESGGHG